MSEYKFKSGDFVESVISPNPGVMTIVEKVSKLQTSEKLYKCSYYSKTEDKYLITILPEKSLRKVTLQ